MSTTLIQVADVLVELDDEGDAIARMEKNGKRWEPMTRNCWEPLVASGKVVIDVGAYTGIYSIASALMGAKVVALEPHPANFKRLKKNAALNSVRISMLNVAASSSRRSMMLRSKRQEHVISDTASLEGDVMLAEIKVDAIAIDELEFTENVGLIKVDVEGHEFKVLTGALQTIKRHRPLILVELLTNEAFEAMSDLLWLHNYRHQAKMDGRNHLYALG